MLGKGLESLIPSAGSGDDSGAQGGILPAPQERDTSAEVRPEETPASAERTDSGDAAILGSPPRGVQEADPPLVVTPPPPATTPPLSSGGGHVYEPQKFHEAIFHIEVEKIQPNPHQPRREFNEESIKELAASIREFGLLQPVVVTKVEREVPTGTEVDYQLISGERRLLAAKMLGLERIPAIIKKVDVAHERLEMAMIENIQRQNLTPIELARALTRLQEEFRMTQREIATRLGKSREVVANTVRLLDLSPPIQDALEKNQITESHGRLLLSITDPKAQEQLFRDLLAQHLTTRELRDRVDGARPRGAIRRKAAGLPPDLLMLQEKLSAELGAPVKIERHGDTGKITISFYSGEELQHIVSRLGGELQ